MLSELQSSAANWAGYLTSMGVTQTGVFDKYWTVANGNPTGLAEDLPPTSGRGLPQTVFNLLKHHDPNAKVRSFVRFIPLDSRGYIGQLYQF